MTATDRAAVRILERALALISRPYGWCQGRFSTGTGGAKAYCAVGALFSSSRSRSVASRSEAYGALKSAISPMQFPGWNDITVWNDEKGRKKSEVQAAFRKAIESLKAR